MCVRRHAKKAPQEGGMSGPPIYPTYIQHPSTSTHKMHTLTFSGAMAAQASCRLSAKWPGKGCSTMIPCTSGRRLSCVMVDSSASKDASPGSCCGRVFVLGVCAGMSRVLCSCVLAWLWGESVSLVTRTHARTQSHS
jgi:hypothetical protein